jgi:hypothetical protein
VNDLAIVVGLIIPALLAVLFRWITPSDDGRLLIAVLVCVAAGFALVPLQGGALAVDTVSTSIVWVWGISQAAFKGGQFMASQVSKE